MLAIQEQFQQMASRSLALHGWTYKLDELGNPILNESGQPKRVAAQEAVQEFMKCLAGIEPDEIKQAEMLRAAWEDKTGTLQHALNAARVVAVGNYIMTQSNFRAAFFETATLAADEQPFVVNETENEIRAGYVGEDGRPKTTSLIMPQERQAIALRVISSEIVRYKTLDVYRGDVSQATKKTFNIAQDLNFKFDREHYNLLVKSVATGGAFGVFSTQLGTGAAKALRIYVPHSGIITAHLPSTNDYDMTAAPNTTDNPTEDGALSRFGILVLKAIVEYCNRWGTLIPNAQGQRLIPTGEILLPASDIIAIANDNLPQANTNTSDIQKQVNTQGYFGLDYLNYSWKFIPDHTIVSGTCYPRFNLLPGLSWEKPNINREFTKIDEVENWEERWQRRCFGAYIITQNRVRAMRIKYA